MPGDATRCRKEVALHTAHSLSLQCGWYKTRAHSTPRRAGLLLFEWQQHHLTQPKRVSDTCTARHDFTLSLSLSLSLALCRTSTLLTVRVRVTKVKCHAGHQPWPTLFSAQMCSCSLLNIHLQFSLSASCRCRPGWLEGGLHPFTQSKAEQHGRCVLKGCPALMALPHTDHPQGRKQKKKHFRRPAGKVGR